MRTVQMLAAATSGALVAGLVTAAPATGAPVMTAVVPVTPVALPAELDRAAFYEKQTLCDPSPRPGTSALADLITTTYGPATIYIPRSCTGSTSEHFDGRALDWMRSARVPAEREMADAFVDWLLAPAADGTPHEMARRLGIMYIIWNNRMIRMYDPGRGWTNYRDCQSSSRSRSSLDTSCHRNHVHLSLSWDGAAGATSWWTGAAQTLPSCWARTTSAKPGSGTPTVLADLTGVPGLVTVTPTPVLDTAQGLGAGLGGSCRVLAGRSLYPKVTTTGVVPAGARLAAVSVTSTSNAPARLSVWSSGARRPSGQVAAPIGTTTSTMLVPIASDGTIGVSTSLGSAALRASVVGYVGGGATVPAAPSASPAPPAPSASPAATKPTPTPSATSAPARPTVAKVTRPSKPRRVKAIAKRGAVKVRWKAPSRTGGATIKRYKVRLLTGKQKGAPVVAKCRRSAKKRACTLTGLTSGATYYASVAVKNAAGKKRYAKRVKVRVR
jgi:hypothetical protein